MGRKHAQHSTDMSLYNLQLNVGQKVVEEVE